MINYDLNLPGDNGAISSFLKGLPGLGGSTLLIFFAAFTILLGFVSLVLYYHWIRYAFGNRMVIFAQVLYTIITFAGLIVMYSSIHAYV